MSGIPEDLNQDIVTEIYETIVSMRNDSNKQEWTAACLRIVAALHKIVSKDMSVEKYEGMDVFRQTNFFAAYQQSPVMISVIDDIPAMAEYNMLLQNVDYTESSALPVVVNRQAYNKGLRTMATPNITNADIAEDDSGYIH